MSEIKEFTTKHKKIISFINKNKDVDIEKMIILFIEVHETMKSSSLDNPTVVNNILSTLNNQNKDIANVVSMITSSSEIYKTELLNLKGMYNMMSEGLRKDIENILSLITNKIYESRDNYIKELKELLHSKETDNILNVNNSIDKQNGILMDKITLLLTNSLPNTLNKNQENLINNFKEDMLNTLNKLLEYDPNITIEKISNIVDMKYNSFAYTIQDQIMKNINTSEDRMSVNINQIKDIAIRTSTIQDRLSTELTEYLNKHKLGITKGIQGENRLLNILNNEYLTSEIINTSCQTGQGDIILKRPDKLPILIETKNYSINVKKDETEKFIRDIDNTKYHGLMLSQCSGIVGKNDFQIDIHNNNILIYIHNANYDISKIRLAVNTIDMLSDKIINANNNNINIDSNILTEINSEFQNMLLQKSMLITQIKDNAKKMLDICTNIELPKLDKLLSNFYANNKKSLLICKVCKKYESYNARSIARHTLSCSKKSISIEDEKTKENVISSELLQELEPSPELSPEPSPELSSELSIKISPKDKKVPRKRKMILFKNTGEAIWR